MNTNAPESSTATGGVTELLSAAADAYDAGKTIRKEAARAAAAAGVKYREIGAGLRLSSSRAWKLVNEDAA